MIATTISQITPAALAAKVREIAEENYNGTEQHLDDPQYVRDGEGSCLLGQAFVALGVLVEELEPLVNHNIVQVYTAAIGVEAAKADPDLDWLWWVQDAQDDGREYLRCVERADAETRSRR